VSYPDEELDYIPMRRWSELHRIASHQFALHDDIFYARLTRRELLVVRYQERIYQPRKFVMLLDVSGSMKDNCADGYSRAEYATASAIALLSNALKGANRAIVVPFDDRPHPAIEGRPQDVVRQLLQCPFSGGGTSIDTALAAADEQSADEIILITDGQDRVSSRIRTPLTVYVCGGHNATLKERAKKYHVVMT
jgi:uncharacterized protein with von Willebrand factor type A (vWA) domain